MIHSCPNLKSVTVSDACDEEITKSKFICKNDAEFIHFWIILEARTGKLSTDHAYQHSDNAQSRTIGPISGLHYTQGFPNSKPVSVEYTAYSI